MPYLNRLMLIIGFFITLFGTPYVIDYFGESCPDYHSFDGGSSLETVTWKNGLSLESFEGDGIIFSDYGGDGDPLFEQSSLYVSDGDSSLKVTAAKGLSHVVYVLQNAWVMEQFCSVSLHVANPSDVPVNVYVSLGGEDENGGVGPLVFAPHSAGIQTISINRLPRTIVSEVGLTFIIEPEYPGQHVFYVDNLRGNVAP